MRVVDVSLRLGAGTLAWPGDTSFSAKPSARIAAGDPANVSELVMSSHTGTHVDAPLHFIEGAAGADALPLDVLVGEVVVADLTGARGPVGAADLKGLGLPDGTARLLLKTPSSALWRQERPEFPASYACLSPEGAGWVVERGIRLVGTDFLSIETRGAPGHPVHATLLGAGVVIVEGLDLGGVEPGEYLLACLPLRVAGCDGAPARAVLIAR